MDKETLRNQETIRQAIEQAFEKKEKLIVVTERNVLAQNSGLGEIKKVLESALKIFEQEEI